MKTQEIIDTAKKLVAGNKGILPMDESFPTWNKRFAKLGWSFSYGRAILQPALEKWRGMEANVTEAQKVPYYRAKCNYAVRSGEYNPGMEKT